MVLQIIENVYSDGSKDYLISHLEGYEGRNHNEIRKTIADGISDLEFARNVCREHLREFGRTVVSAKIVEEIKS